jgi:hypothetical protein
MAAHDRGCQGIVHRGPPESEWGGESLGAEKQRQYGIHTQQKFNRKPSFWGDSSMSINVCPSNPFRLFRLALFLDFFGKKQKPFRKD